MNKKNSNFNDNVLNENNKVQFLKLLAVIFAAIALYTILNDPFRVFHGFLDCFK